ncbi:serine hydrolase domain-containing protein [Chryseobacterium potabilaquae]|uniref:Penicillin-binding protein 4 n=1 Tax=Chryseobacterium potabilaquae TaxID=2675057 RepID=A0A6N4X8N4_9FLAO|nr:serine hydrolase domain-containing protein [Chryseobacterium potabilaquae]CAA7194744.1 Penicillin-binding protein 4* [Chryseobacterium potabilaquae]
MLKKSYQIMLFLFISLGVISCQTEHNPIKTTNRNTIVDSTISIFEKKMIGHQMDSIFKKYNFNGSVGIFRDSIPIYRKNNGYSDFTNRIPIDSNTVFAIGSISKQFTAILILLQMEQEKLSINDKVSHYLPEFQTKEYENILISQLLNHTSGLNTLGGKLMFKSGTDFFYSNEGFDALGKIVEKVTGKTFDTNIGELFKRVGMKNSSTGNTFEGKDFAGAYLGDTLHAEKILNMPKRLGDKNIGIPAGGILSTIGDLQIWNNALYNGKILKAETFKQFISKSAERHHPVFGKMGYGYGIMLNIGKPLAYFHSGYIKGAPSLNIYYPESHTSVIILSNIADEAKGKNAIFRPHIEIKESTDLIENTIMDIKKEMLEPQRHNL